MWVWRIVVSSGEPGAAAEGAGLVLRGVGDRDVDARQALVELVGGRHLAHDEAEVEEEARGHRGGRKLEGQPRRHAREEDRGEAEQELAVLRRGLPLQDLRHLREPRGPLLGIAVHHRGSLLVIPRSSISPGDEGSTGVADPSGPVLSTALRMTGDRTRPSGGKSSRAPGCYNPSPGAGGRRVMKFEISYRGGTTHEVELPGSVAVLGRDPGCDIVLNDSKCSRRHAVVEDGPKGLVVRDSGSANGVYVNGRRVDEARLQPGDVLRLGDVQLKLLAEVGETVVMAPEDLDLRTAGGAPRPPDLDLPLRDAPAPPPAPKRPSGRAPRCARRPSRGGPRRGPADRPRSPSWWAFGPSSCRSPSPPASWPRTGWAEAPWPGPSAP